MGHTFAVNDKQENQSIECCTSRKMHHLRLSPPHDYSHSPLVQSTINKTLNLTPCKPKQQLPVMLSH